MTQEEIDGLTPDERREALLSCMDRSSKLIAKTTSPIRHKPILGGRFGSGGYSLCSFHEVADGLDSVIFFVSHEKSGYIFGMAEDKAEALTFARSVLAWIDPVRLQTRMQRHKEWFEAEQASRLKEREEASARRLEEFRAANKGNVRSIPKRRKRIFDESNGQCHYCSTTLTLDGKWHIEHKMPKALGGGNEPGNLVASCVSCNMKKRDSTDVEFKARMAAGAKE